MTTPFAQWYRENKLPGDAAVAMLLLLVGLFLQLAASGTSQLELLFTVILVVPLIWRRTEPDLVFVITAALCLVQLFLFRSLIGADLVIPVLVHAVSAYSTVTWRIAALVTGISGSGLMAALWWRDTRDFQVGSVGFVAGAVIVLAAYLLGVRQRDRQERQDEQVAGLTERNRLLAVERDQRAEMAASAERTRIARELHDIVAHSLSVIVVQADGGVAASKAKPEVAHQVLATIADTAGADRGRHTRAGRSGP